MTIYNALPQKEYERIFMCKTTKEVWRTLIITHQVNSQVKDCKIDLLTQQYDKFSISSEESIDSGFIGLNIIVTCLKYLYQDYSSKNHVRKFLRPLSLKWRAKVMTIEEVKDLSTLLLYELIRNFKGNRFGHGNRFSNRGNRFGRGRGNGFGNKGGGSSIQKRECYNCEEECHIIGECPKPKEKKAFVGGARSDSEDGNEPNNEATCLMAVDSQEVQPKPSISNNDLDIIDLQKDNEEILNMKVEELLNVIFDESPTTTKLSPLVDDDDVGEEEAIERKVLLPLNTK
ncbi:zf-CCHC domain-containing protein [Tanacetum coccineum]|uniref:Zf-CCHC domain-containing protein n=1 Tax=Tanacetum coccineum TaxID=301880 RepID=A0ABQ5CZA3_9ASTR